MGQGTKTRLLTVGVLVTVFGAGVLLGLAADSTLTPTPAAASTAVASGVAEEVESERRIPMYEQVGPDPVQAVVIDSIVREHQARMDALNREFQERYNPQYRAIVEETREAIKVVFTPEQAAQYQALVEERDRRRAEEAAGGGDEEEEE